MEHSPATIVTIEMNRFRDARGWNVRADQHMVKFININLIKTHPTYNIHINPDSVEDYEIVYLTREA
jgi:hypothetical protein